MSDSNISKPTVFLSYNQAASDHFADEVEKRLSSVSTVVRDKSTMKDWDSIVDFMKSIRKQDMVVMLVTNNYLQSIGCMFEVSQTMKDEEWIGKTMFVVADDARDIYDATKQAEYHKFWKEKEENLIATINSIGDPASSSNVTEELKKVREIRACLPSFIGTVRDRKNPDVESAITKIYERVSGKAEGKLKRPILHPINEQFLEVFDEFMNSDLKNKMRAASVRQYVEGLVDVLLKDVIVKHLDGKNYKDCDWNTKLKIIEEHYDRDITEKLRIVSSVNESASSFWGSITEDELDSIISIANHLIEDIFVLYFTTSEHRFGTENIFFYFSALPLENRIYVLERVYKLTPIESVVDRLSLAYTKNGEKQKADELLDEALKNRIIIEDRYWLLKDRDAQIEANVHKAYEANGSIEDSNGWSKGVFINENQIVVGYTPSKDIFDAAKLYDVMKACFQEDYPKYPDFFKMLLLLLSRDSREYMTESGADEEASDTDTIGIGNSAKDILSIAKESNNQRNRNSEDNDRPVPLRNAFEFRNHALDLIVKYRIEAFLRADPFSGFLFDMIIDYDSFTTDIQDLMDRAIKFKSSDQYYDVIEFCKATEAYATYLSKVCSLLNDTVRYINHYDSMAEIQKQEMKIEELRIDAREKLDELTNC